MLKIIKRKINEQVMEEIEAIMELTRKLKRKEYDLVPYPLGKRVRVLDRWEWQRPKTEFPKW